MASFSFDLVWGNVTKLSIGFSDQWNTRDWSDEKFN